MSWITLTVPNPESRAVEIDGRAYPVVNGAVTVPGRFLTMLLDNGYHLVSHATRDTDILSGATGDLPAAGAFVGQVYFDTTLGFPFYWSGSAWVNETKDRWDDILGDITQGTNATALTYETYRDTNHKLYFLRHDQADELHFRFQMPHAWDETTSVRPHLHFVPMVEPLSSPLVFGVKGEWCWADYGRSVPANASWTPIAVTQNIVTGDAFKSKILALGTLAPTATYAKGSSVLLIRLYRDTGATDTYTTGKSAGAGQTAAANIALLSCDVHYQKKWQGTPAELPA